MKPANFYRWHVPDERKPGKTRLTLHLMTEADALARHPGATPHLPSLEVRELPETDEEIAKLSTAAWMRNKA